MGRGSGGGTVRKRVGDRGWLGVWREFWGTFKKILIFHFISVLKKMGVLRNFGGALRYKSFQIIQARNFAGAQAGPGLKF